MLTSRRRSFDAVLSYQGVAVSTRPWYQWWQRGLIIALPFTDYMLTQRHPPWGVSNLLVVTALAHLQAQTRDQVGLPLTSLGNLLTEIVSKSCVVGLSPVLLSERGVFLLLILFNVAIISCCRTLSLTADFKLVSNFQTPITSSFCSVWVREMKRDVEGTREKVRSI